MVEVAMLTLRFFPPCAPILLGWCLLVSSSNAITLELEPESDARDAFYFQANHWSPLFTEVPQLRLRGSTEAAPLEFLLLRVNDRMYPIRPLQGQFELPVQLDPGENQIRLESNLKHLPPVERTVFRVEAARLTQVQDRTVGGEGSVIPLQEMDADGDATHLRVRLQSPIIKVSGIRGTHPVVELKVKDPYNNTLPVQLTHPNGFTIDYTARERRTHLDFISSLNNRELGRQRLHLELEELIQFHFDTLENPAGWWIVDASNRMPQAQVDTVTLVGSLQAVTEGEVEVVLGNEVHKVPVINHQFRAELPLQLNQINRGRVRVNFNNQSFFESFQIDQHEPEVTVDALQRYQIDGSVLLPEPTLKIDSSSVLQLPQGMLRLAGYAQFRGDLRLVLERSPDGSTITLAESSGRFEVDIPLELGEAGYHLLLEGGGFARPYFSFETEVQPAIKVDAVNFLPYRTGPLKLKQPELLLRGRVMGVQRGLMQLMLGDALHAVPVLQERFEMERAVPVPEGCDRVQLQLNAGALTLKREFALELTLPEPAPETADDAADEEADLKSLPFESDPESSSDATPESNDD